MLLGIGADSLCLCLDAWVNRLLRDHADLHRAVGVCRSAGELGRLLVFIGAPWLAHRHVSWPFLLALLFSCTSMALLLGAAIYEVLHPEAGQSHSASVHQGFNWG